MNPRLLGMKKVVSEDAVRRGLAKIDEAAGLRWLQTHLDYCAWPLLSEPWVLDIDSTIKPLYGRQEGAMVGSLGASNDSRRLSAVPTVGDSGNERLSLSRPGGICAVEPAMLCDFCETEMEHCRPCARH